MKQVPNHFSYYATEEGRIWSGPRGIFKKDSLGRNTFHGHNGKWLKPGVNSSGYLSVNLYDYIGSGKHKGCLVHQLVLETFVGKKPQGTESRHLNGNRLDNRLSNLCWGTRSENQQDSVRHGTHGGLGVYGEKNPNSKITDSERKLVICVYLTGLLKRKQISTMFGISIPLVDKIAGGRVYPFFNGVKLRKEMNSIIPLTK